MTSGSYSTTTVLLVALVGVLHGRHINVHSLVTAAAVTGTLIREQGVHGHAAPVPEAPRRCRLHVVCCMQYAWSSSGLLPTDAPHACTAILWGLHAAGCNGAIAYLVELVPRVRHRPHRWWLAVTCQIVAMASSFVVQLLTASGSGSDSRTSCT